MFHLFKRDLLLYGWSVLFLLLIIPITAAIPIDFTFFTFSIALIVHLFYYDNKSGTNRFLVSLPIEKRLLIGSRYLITFLVMLIVISYQCLISYLYSIDPDPFIVYLYDWKDILLMVSLVMMFVAVAIPMYYFFQSFVVSVTIQMILFIFILSFYFLESAVLQETDGYFYINSNAVIIRPVLESYFSSYTYIIIPIIAVIMYCASMLVSETLLKRKVI